MRTERIVNWRTRQAHACMQPGKHVPKHKPCSQTTCTRAHDHSCVPPSHDAAGRFFLLGRRHWPGSRLSRLALRHCRPSAPPSLPLPLLHPSWHCPVACAAVSPLPLLRNTCSWCGLSPSAPDPLLPLPLCMRLPRLRLLLLLLLCMQLLLLPLTSSCLLLLLLQLHRKRQICISLQTSVQHPRATVRKVGIVCWQLDHTACPR